MEEVEAGLVDVEALSKELMKSVLGPYVQFDRVKQEFVFTEKWNKLNNNLKLLTYLIGRKGMYAAGHLKDEEAVVPKTMVEQMHLPSGSVSYTVKVLFDGKLIAKTNSGKYFVPNAKLLVVGGMIRDAGKGQASEVAVRKKVRPRKGTVRRREKGE